MTISKYFTEQSSFARLSKLFISPLFLSASLLTTAVQAAPSAPLAAIERQNQLIQNQQQERLREDQQRALGERPAPGGTNLNNIKPRVASPDIGVQCRNISRIEITGDEKMIPAKLLAKVRHDYTGRCISVSDIESLLGLLTKDFIDRGFITTRVYLPVQDLRTGILKLTVVAGKIESYKLEGGRKHAVWLRAAMPGREGDVLNLRDLEQGIDQMNSLSSNNARLDLLPGDLPGQSIVAIQNDSSLPVHLFTSFDNLGSDATGRNALSATVTTDSLLGLNELIAITRRQSAFPFSGEHRSDSTALLMQFPWGYNTLSVNYSQSNYINGLSLPGGVKLKTNGKSDNWYLGANHVLFRNQSSRVGLSAHLNTQLNQNWLGGELLTSSSRRLTYLDAGADMFSIFAGGIFNGNIAVVQGVPWFNGTHDPGDLPDEYPHAQSRKFTLDMGYNRTFYTGNTGLGFSTSFSGQLAADTLYGTQQILIGGPSSVRGFQNMSLSGDSGYYVRNDFSVSRDLPGGINGRLYAAFDWGDVTNRAAGVPSGSLSGTAAGLGLLWKTVSINAFVSHAVTVPSHEYREGTLFSLLMSASL